MYTDYWCATDLLTADRKDPFKGNYPSNLNHTSFLGEKAKQRKDWPNTTSDFSRNVLRKPHFNGQPPINPYERENFTFKERDVIALKRNSYISSHATANNHTKLSNSSIKKVLNESLNRNADMTGTAATSSSLSTSTSIVGTSKTSAFPKHVPNSGNIGYCLSKSNRQLQMEISNRKGYMEAAAIAQRGGLNPEAGRVVHSEAHHYRFQYPHTLGRMKSYAKIKDNTEMNVWKNV